MISRRGERGAERRANESSTVSFSPDVRWPLSRASGLARNAHFLPVLRLSLGFDSNLYAPMATFHPPSSSASGGVSCEPHYSKPNDFEVGRFTSSGNSNDAKREKITVKPGLKTVKWPHDRTQICVRRREGDVSPPFHERAI